MRIGIDFDNTIVSYDHIFHKAAVEAGLVPPQTEPTKPAVRDFLRAIDREDDWTELQGYVYGERMGEADLYPGVIEFLRRGRQRGNELFVVSHKTRYPFRGKRYDLHDAARTWVSAKLRDDGGAMLRESDVFFELTKEAKIERIVELRCDYFIDDLAEILLAPRFPARTRRILFDPHGAAVANGSLTALKNWQDISDYVGSATAR